MFAHFTSARAPRRARRPSWPAAVALVTGTVAGLAAPAPAAAKIQCRQGYQIVQGNSISTPYCQDEYVAQVARGYGVSTSGARIRGNPQHKNEVCRLVGRDIRIQQACLDALPSGRRFF
jgi:hypothetical protein